GFDLEVLLAVPGARLDCGRDVSGALCLTHADVVERLEILAHDLFLALERTGFQERAIDEIVSSLLGRPSDAAAAPLRFACRTLGDDVAEVLALLGVAPVWDPHTRRVQDLVVTPLEQLARPRIDVTLRISGFFRDAFPHLIALVDRAIELVVALDEPVDRNYP